MTDRRNFYETLYLVRPDIGEDDLSAIRGKLASALKDNEAETIRDEKWDERDLAYEVNGYRRGAYHILTYRALPGAPAALEKHLGFHKSDIMRFITVSVDEDQAHGREPEKPPAPPPPRDEDDRRGYRRDGRDNGGRGRFPGRRDERRDERPSDEGRNPEGRSPEGRGSEGRDPWKSARRREEDGK